MQQDYHLECRVQSVKCRVWKIPGSRFKIHPSTLTAIGQLRRTRDSKFKIQDSRFKTLESRSQTQDPRPHLSTFHLLLSTHSSPFPHSTFHSLFPFSTFHFPLSTFYFSSFLSNKIRSPSRVRSGITSLMQRASPDIPPASPPVATTVALTPISSSILSTILSTRPAYP